NLLLFAAVLGKCNTQHSVNQPTRVQTVSEHEMVKLHCIYSTSDSYPSLYWYQHKTNGLPVYMLRKLSTGSSSSEKEFEERFHADLDKSSSSVSLSIQDVRVSDSAVYYCALPTVTGNKSTLYKNLTLKGNNGLLQTLKS
uniref:Ig-like domain-containing protein n=1 Tax=Sinocyclocheilus anshuiensis TaxID=1608454 RepID=A0A671PBV3_9TELE